MENQENTSVTEHEKSQDIDAPNYKIDDQPFYVVDAINNFSDEEVEDRQVEGHYNQALNTFDESYPLISESQLATGYSRKILCQIQSQTRRGKIAPSWFETE